MLKRRLSYTNGLHIGPLKCNYSMYLCILLEIIQSTLKHVTVYQLDFFTTECNKNPLKGVFYWYNKEVKGSERTLKHHDTKMLKHLDIKTVVIASSSQPFPPYFFLLSCVRSNSKWTGQSLIRVIGLHLTLKFLITSQQIAVLSIYMVIKLQPLIIT